MRILSVSSTKANYSANLNHSHKKAAFTGIEKLKKYPEYDRLIEETSSGVIYPAVEKYKDFLIALTGAEAAKFWKLKREKNIEPLETVVRESGKSHFLV